MSSWPPRSPSSPSVAAGSSSSSRRATGAPSGSTGSIAKPGRFLAVSQLAITFVGFLAAAFAGANTAQALEPLLASLGSLAGPAAIIIVTLAVAFVTAIFGELIPKTLALAHAERYAILFARPIEIMGRVLAPVVSVLDGITGWFTRRMGVSMSDRDRISPEELMILVERGGEQGIIEAEEEQMIGAVLGLGERKVHEVMVPRIAMVALPASASLDQMVDTIVEGGHSRIPVYEDSVDNVVGILYAKDLLPYLKGVDQPPPMGRLVRAPLFVPESMSVDDLLHSLQRRRVHIAIVLDEYGGTAGMVTIEDLLEEIVGEIQDEYDTEEPIDRAPGRRPGARGWPCVHRGPAGAFRPAHRCDRGPGGVRHRRRPHLPPHRGHPEGR